MTRLECITEPTVFCPLGERLVEVMHCLNCEDFDGKFGNEIECKHPERAKKFREEHNLEV